MRSGQKFLAIAAVAVTAMLLAACGSEATAVQAAGAQSAGAQSTGDSDRPVVVATTNILGDVLENLAGDAVDVVTIMPVGADPHTFQPSAQQVAAIEAAGAIVVNGEGFEEGLLDAVGAAESRGTLVFEAMSMIDAIEADGDAHDHGDEDHGDEHEDHDGDDEHEDHDDEDHDDEHEDHDDEDHDDEHEDHDDEDHGDEDHDDEDHGDEDHDDEHEDDEEHAHSGEDPHFFTDPARMAIVVEGIADFLIANVDGIDAAAVEASAAEYVEELETLDRDVEEMLASVPEDQRVLVTNHEVFGYFADRYDFEVIGAVIPSGSSTEGVSGQRLAELADLLEEEGVSVVFADTSSSDELAQTLANEVGDVDVVALFSESLGSEDSDGATYVDMVRTNATRIAEALAS